MTRLIRNLAHGALILLAVAIVISGCQKKPEEKATETATQMTANKEPERIQVQHILIAFSGSIPGKTIKRSEAEAKKLAEDILKKAQGGTNYDALVKENTDDRAPGIYSMANRGVQPQGDEFPREQMVPAFGDVGFALKVGEIRLAAYDQAKSPFGYHIIKRLK